LRDEKLQGAVQIEFVDEFAGDVGAEAANELVAEMIEAKPLRALTTRS
jgi:hypothetical protein